MIPYSVEIVGKEEPIDAVKLAYAENKKTGGRYLHAVTIDNRIATIDLDRPGVIVWENSPTKEDLAIIDRLIQEAYEDKGDPPSLAQGVEYQ